MSSLAAFFLLLGKFVHKCLDSLYQFMQKLRQVWWVATLPMPSGKVRLVSNLVTNLVSYLNKVTMFSSKTTVPILKPHLQGLGFDLGMANPNLIRS